MAEKVVKLPEKDELTPVQRLAKLDAERAEILASAKADALKKASEAVDELNLLGFKYELTEPTEKAPTTRGQPSDLLCPICHYKTTPPA